MTTGVAVVEHALAFECEGESLFGILTTGSNTGPLGVVIVVGGPQYRVGSHRQFVLLARHLAAAGLPTLRFDYRGMGDSTGARRTFDSVDADIRAAIDALKEAAPALREVALWGLCDGASAALIYAATDPRVSAVVLANPWVRAEQTYARARLRAYYWRRPLSLEFWTKLLRGGLEWRKSLGEAHSTVARALQGKATEHGSFRDKMMSGLDRFGGRVLLLLSGRDLTATEFEQFVRSEPRASSFRGPKVTTVRVPEADHTFSEETAMRTVERATSRWLAVPSRDQAAAASIGQASRPRETAFREDGP